MSSATLTMDAAEPSRPAINPWIIALSVTLATFMEVLDTSVANVSLPHIAGSLSAGMDESTWVLASYLVSNAIILPMGAWFSMLLGRSSRDPPGRDQAATLRVATRMNEWGASGST